MTRCEVICLVTHGAVGGWGPFVLEHGCGTSDAGCFGPQGNYWTVFGSELVLLGEHAGLAAIAAILFGVGSAYAWRRRGAAPRTLLALLGALIVFGVMFLGLAWAFPDSVDY